MLLEKMKDKSRHMIFNSKNTVLTRDQDYSESEMRMMRIIHIHNVCGDHDMMTPGWTDGLFKRLVYLTGSSWILVESSLSGKGGRCVSALVFADEVSRNMYGLRYPGVYGSLYAGMGFIN